GVAYSPDGRTLATTHEDLRARLWDVRQGKERQRLGPCRQGYPLLLLFAPDGRTLATGEVGGTGRGWDSGSGKELQHFEGGTTCQGPEADTLFVGRGEDVLAFDRTTGAERQRLPKVGGFGWYVQTLACAPDGRTLAARNRDAIRLVDRATGKVVRQFPCGG